MMSVYSKTSQRLFEPNAETEGVNVAPSVFAIIIKRDLLKQLHWRRGRRSVSSLSSHIDRRVLMMYNKHNSNNNTTNNTNNSKRRVDRAEMSLDAAARSRFRATRPCTADLHTKILDFGGLDSSRILN